MKFARRKSRRAIAGIVATVIMFAILFTVGTSYFIFVNSENSAYVTNLLAATSKAQGSLQESLTINSVLETDGDIGFTANNTSSVTVNMTAVLVISDAGALLKCDGVGFPAGAGCSNTTPTLWRTINAGGWSSSIDTGYVYVTGTTDTIKVLTARGNTYSATYPGPADQSTSSQSVTVALDDLKWVQLLPQASSYVQKNYVSNCNAANCALAYNSHVTAGNILVAGIGWVNHAAPSTPTDTLSDQFTLGASSSVTVATTPALVQSKYTSNCNAAACGLAFSSNVVSGHTLVYAVGWANQSPPSAPTDTRGDTFTLGASNSLTVNPATPAVVQHRYLSNCSSATCGLAYSSSVTAGNTLVFGLGWPTTVPYNYVPLTVTNCQLQTYSLSIDGSATGDFGSTSSGAVTLTTTSSNDVIVVVVGNENTPNTASRTVSSVTSAGLSFSKRSSGTVSSAYLDLEVWYAIAASPLSAASITVTLSGSTDSASIVAFGVSGANTSSPWDANGALPAVATSTSNAVPTVTGVSTSNANDMLLGFEGAFSTSNPGTQSNGSGFTLIQSLEYRTGFGHDYSQASAEDNIVSATQSSVSIAFSASLSNWVTVGDAIKQAPAGCASGLSIDSSNSNECDNTTSCSVSLTTSNTNDLIYVMATDSSGGNVLTSFSDSAGLSWTQRAAQTSDANLDVYTYYAVAVATLSSDSITYHISASGNMRVVALAISGANTGAPFDPNLATAPKATNTGTTATVSVTTTNANDIIIGAVKADADSITAGASGFTSIICCTTTYAALQYKIVSSTGTYTPSFTISASTDWGEVGDAIRAAASTSTPTTFQQMVTWDPATYSAYEATNLGNVRFCADDACNTPLYAWLESCSNTCSSAGSTSTSATAWVKLTSSISSGASTTIYMVFEGTSVNFDGNYWGEAPNLSSTYAQYDNGANVFTAYFNGNTATSSFSVATGYTVAQATGVTYGSGTVSVIKLTGYGTNTTPLVFNVAMTTTGLVVESNFENTNHGTDSGTTGLVDNAAAGSVQNAISTNSGIGNAYFNQDYISGGTITENQNDQGTASTQWLYGSTSYPGTSSSSYSGYVAPQLYSTTGGYLGAVNVNPISGAAHLYLGSVFTTNSGATANMLYNWDRARAYPPNGIMPSTSLGTLSTGTGSPATVTDTLGDSFTVGASTSVLNSGTTYESSLWYATAVSSGSDTITATFGASVSGSVSIYEITGYSTSGVLSSTGSSSAGSSTASVGSFTPSSNSFAVGNVEAGSATGTFTAGSGYTLSGSCSSVEGCGEYETGLGSATTTSFSLSGSTPWVDVAMSFAPLTTNTYYSYVYYATAGSSGADTISASFGSTVAGSVSIYEVSGVTTTGLLTGTGSSSTSQSATSVSSITPTVAASVVIGNAETTSTSYTAGSGYTLTNSQSCATVTGCAEYQTGVSSATTVPLSISPSAPWVESAVAFAPVQTVYYSYIWYATAATSGADTITAAFGTTVTASVSIYEITGYTTSGALSSTGSSSSGSTTTGVTSFTPASNSFIVANAESASATSTYTAGSGYTLAGTCNSVYGCSQYNAGGGGSATTLPMTLSASTGWAESAMSFSTPFNPQSGIQVNGYPTMGVPSGASLVWEVTFTDVDPQHRAITIWPQTEMAIGSAEYDGFDTDYTQAHYYLINSLNSGSVTVNAYSTNSFITLAYNTPTVLYFAATQALGSTTQAFGTNVLTPFEAYFALTGTFSDGTLFGETIPYPYGIITEANAYTTPSVGLPSSTATVSCTSPCDFDHSVTAMVGWINSAGELTPLTTFTTSSSGNIPSGVTFTVPATATAGYYTIEVTDYINTVFMTYQVT